MTGSDPTFSSRRPGPGMIRPDYRLSAQLPGPLRLAPVVPVRRPLARARDCCVRWSRARTASGAPRARRRRGGLGQEPPRARVRPRGRGRRRARPLRRLRRGRPASVPAVRRGARPARARHGRRRRCGPISAPAAASSRGSLPDLALRVGELPPPVAADPDTERHRLHSAVADLLGRRQPPRAARARRRGRPLGRHADAAAPAPPRPRARRARVLVLATTFRDTEADIPRGAGRGARRPAALGGRRAPAARRPERRRDRRVRGARRRGDLGPELPDLGRVAARAHRRQRVPDDRAVADAARDRDAVRPRRRRAARAARSPELGSPEGVREVVGQRLARLGPRRPRLLELAAVAGPRVRPRGRRARRARTSAELHAALDAGRRARHDRGGAGAAARLPVHATSWCGARSTTVCPALRRAELHLRVGEALETPGAGERPPALAELAHHFAAAAPRRRAAARRSTTRVLAGRPRWRRSPSTRPRRASRPRSSSASTTRGGAARRSSSSARRASAPARSDDAMDGLRARPPRSPASSATPSCSPRAAVGFEEACWRPAITDAGRGRAARGGAAALGDEDSQLRVMRAGRPRPRALAFRRQPRGQRACVARARRPRWRGAWTTASGSPRCSCGPTGRARDGRLEDTLDMLVRGARPRRGARRRRAAGRGDGVARRRR